MVLDGLLSSENGRQVSQDGTHARSEGLHILGNEDIMLLGLIP